MKFTGIAPLLIAATIIAPGSGAISAAGVAPRNDRAIVSTAGSVSATGYAPTVTVSGSASITPLVGSLVLGIPRTNLLLYSEQFDNAAWRKTFSSVSPEATTAPNGSNTADKLVEDTNNNQHYVVQAASGISSGIATFSVYAKAAERTWLRMQTNQFFGFAWFNLSLGVVGTVNGGVVATITPAGNGWYRCTCTSDYVGPGCYLFIADANNSSSHQGDGASGIYIWGAQAEQSSDASIYIPTTDAPVTAYGNPPVISLGTFISGTVGSLSAAGNVPRNDLGIVSTVGSLTLAGNAPSVRQATFITPSIGSITIGGVSPSIRTDSRITGGVGSAAIAGVAPTVSVSDLVSIAPSAGQLSLVGASPSVVVPGQTDITPAIGSVAISGIAPTIQKSDLISVTPLVGSVGLSGLSPTVQVSNLISITPSVGGASFAGAAPTVQVSNFVSISPFAGGASFAGVAPTVQVSDLVSITSPAGALSLVGYAPSDIVVGEMDITPPAGGMILLGVAPTVEASTQTSRTPQTGMLSFLGVAPSGAVQGEMYASLHFVFKKRKVNH